MRFAVTFHTPFRIAPGRAGDGSDTTIDPEALLPASSIKGVMLSAARDVLRFPSPRIVPVFGGRHVPSPWAWSDGTVTGPDGGPPRSRPRARIQIDPDTSTVRPKALAVADEVLAARAEFTVDRIGWIDPDQIDWHEIVLLASARAVTALGGDRRRGLGWVSVSPVDPPWSAELAGRAVALRAGEVSSGA
jgi:CRISPR/Cas system CSM-associated protein Csm3 (group 7 of RAMP superfamily)